MKNILFIICIFFTLNSLSQNLEVLSIEKEQLAPNTTIVASGESTFRVITSNPELSTLLMKEDQDFLTRISIVPKEDRLGWYYEYSIYYSNKYYQNIRLKIINQFD